MDTRTTLLLARLCDDLVREADDRVLLAAAEQSWQRIGGDWEALAAYKAEASALESFDLALPEY